MTPWDALGLAPTDDRRAIRRAYADLLKALDVDGDPQAFERLRRARDWALASADAGGFDTAAVEGGAGESGAVEGAPVEDATVAEVAVEAPAEDPTPAEAVPTPEWLSEVVRHHAALTAILTAGDGRTPTDGATEAAMLAHFEGMIADPRLADVGFQADAEQWFAHVIAHACPRADPLVLPAARRFNWLDGGDEVGRSNEIVWLTRRARAFLFLDEVRQPRHPYHREWRELCTPAGEGSRRSWRLNRKKVLALLALVRGSYPALEDHLDWYRVGLWEKREGALGNGLRRTIAIVVWIGLMSAAHFFGQSDADRNRAMGYGTTSTSTTAPAVPFYGALSDLEIDLDGALRPMFGSGLTTRDLAQHSPKLLAILQNYWKTDKNADVGRDEFGQEIRDLLAERFPGDLRKAGYPLVSGYRRFELDLLVDAAKDDYASCDAFITGKAPLPESMRIRRNALVGQILLHADDGSPLPKTQTTYMVPGDLVAKAELSSGLTHEQFVGAMRGSGTPETRCRKQMALLKAALALPEKAGLPLLRRM